MNIYYDHDERKITDDSGKEYTYLESQQLILSGKAKDWNLAYQRLNRLGGDMEALEAYYKVIRESEKRKKKAPC